jgi:hypothetical protein
MSGILWPIANLIVVPPLVFLEWPCHGFQNVPIWLRAPEAFKHVLSMHGQARVDLSLSVQVIVSKHKRRVAGTNVKPTGVPSFFGLHIMRREVSAHSEVTSAANSDAMDQPLPLQNFLQGTRQIC